MLDRVKTVHVETEDKAKRIQTALARVKPGYTAETFALLTSPRKEEREEGKRRVREWGKVSQEKGEGRGRKREQEAHSGRMLRQSRGI